MPKPADPPKQPKKNKPPVKPDLTAKDWFKDEVCAYMRWSPETLRRRINERGFPAGRHDPNARLRTDKKSGKLIPCDKARWLPAEVIQWDIDNPLVPYTPPANDNISPEDRRKLLKLIDEDE